MRMTLRQFSALVGKDYATVLKWAREQRIEAIQFTGHWSVSITEYERYLSEGLLPVNEDHMKNLEERKKAKKAQQAEKAEKAAKRKQTEKVEEKVSKSKLRELSKNHFRTSNIDGDQDDW